MVARAQYEIMMQAVVNTRKLAVIVIIVIKA
jgi:hypothetical protein